MPAAGATQAQRLARKRCALFWSNRNPKEKYQKNKAIEIIPLWQKK